MTPQPPRTGTESAAAAPESRLLTPGVRDMLAASLLFACMSLLVKLVTTRLPPSHAMLARSLVGLALSWGLLRHMGLPMRGSRPGLLVLRGAVGFSALICSFHALSMTPLGDAVVIFQTQPVWTALFAAVFLGERASPRLFLGCAVAMAGVALVARPVWLFGLPEGVAAVEGSGMGPLLAAASAMLSAIAYVIVRALRQSDPPLTVVFWFAVVATPASLPGVLANPVMPEGVEWLLLIGIGLAVQAAQMLMTRALHREPAGRVSAASYVQLTFSFLIGLAFLGEIPTATSLAGAACTVAGALIATWRPRPQPQ
jgi:drug/metabolite transporter (DMT)-like permease